VWRKPSLRGTVQLKCFTAIALRLSCAGGGIAETPFLGQSIQTVAVFDIVNGLILLHLSPDLDLTSDKHVAGAFLSAAQELKVGEDCLHQDRLFPESTALSFELPSKLALFSRHALLG